MIFNVDRIAQLAGLAGSNGSASGSPGTLTESAGARRRPASTYDRVVEELQLRGLEMFYSPEQINEAIRVESRLLREEREMDAGMGSMHHSGGHDDMPLDEMIDDALAEVGDDHSEAIDVMGDEPMDEMGYYEGDDMGHATDEEAAGLQVGDKIMKRDGTELEVKKAQNLAESRLRKMLSREVESVLKEMTNSGDTAWMYGDAPRPTRQGRGVTMGFAGVGFKKR